MEGVDLSPESEQIVNEADPAGALGLFALVTDFLKMRGKGCRKGDRKSGKGRPKTCFECRAKGHIGAESPVRASCVAAGGPGRLDKPDDAMKGIEGGGKKGGKKSDKGKGKLGVWTSTGRPRRKLGPHARQAQGLSGRSSVPHAVPVPEPLAHGRQGGCSGSSPAMGPI